MPKLGSCRQPLRVYGVGRPRVLLNLTAALSRCDVPEGPVASVGGSLILGERGHHGGQRSDGAGSQQARGGRGKGLDRVDDHDEGSVV